MIRGVIFDKDGTLLQFEPLWANAGPYLAKGILEKNGLAQKQAWEHAIMEEIGALPGEIKSDGAFACNTYGCCGQIISKILAKYGVVIAKTTLAKQLEEMSNNYVCSPEAKYVACFDFKECFERLKAMDIKIGLITADTQKAAHYAAQRFSIDRYLDYMEGTGQQGRKAKPNKEPVERFCQKFRIQPNEVAIVGDTATDIKFAKNSGAFSIGVLSGVCSREELSPVADCILPHGGMLTKEVLDSLGDPI